MIIDAYTHCGQEKFRPLPDVQQMMAVAGISGAVLAQHLGQYDNSYIAQCVRTAPNVLAGVAMIDATAPSSAQALDEVIGSGAFRGLRMTAAMLAEAPAIASAALEAGLHLVLYCPDGTEAIRGVLPGLAHASGRIVITHLGSPVVADGRLVRGQEILELAADDRVMVTLSGAGMACEPPHLAVRPLVQAIVSALGAERIMWASNFPVVGDAEAVRDDLRLLLENAWDLPAHAIPLIAGAVAAHTWFSGRSLA